MYKRQVLYAERFGVSDAAKERGKLAIGNVIDTQPQYPETVVASALWSMEPTIDEALKQVKGGTFKAADFGQYSLMKHKGSSLAPLGTFESKIPADLIAKVQDVYKRQGLTCSRTCSSASTASRRGSHTSTCERIASRPRATAQSQ